MAALCVVCRKTILEAERALSAPRHGRFVCPNCAGPRVAIPGVTLGRLLSDDYAGARFDALRSNGERCHLTLFRWADRFPFEPWREERLRAAGAIGHPNVARILGWGVAVSSFWIAQEPLPPDTIGSLMKRGPLQLGTAVSIAHGIVLGVRAILAASVSVPPLDRYTVHAEGGTAKISMAQCVPLPSFALERGWAIPSAPHMGDLPFQSPEHIEDAARAMEPRSLAYTVGALLYGLLAGRPPFTAKSNMDFFMKILHEEPTPLAASRSDIPDIVLGIVRKCLAKKPEDRYSLEELEQALDLRGT